MNLNQPLVPITPAIKLQVLSLIDEIMALLPGLNTLTPPERHNMRKMGNVNQSYVYDAYSDAEQNPNLVPSYFNVLKFKEKVDLTVSTDSIE